mgnify:CR=1 FL=1
MEGKSITGYWLVKMSIRAADLKPGDKIMIDGEWYKVERVQIGISQLYIYYGRRKMIPCRRNDLFLIDA